MKKALAAAAKVLMDIHDQNKPKVQRRPRGLCQCLHCHVLRHEGVE